MDFGFGDEEREDEEEKPGIWLAKRFQYIAGRALDILRSSRLVCSPF